MNSYQRRRARRYWKYAVEMDYHNMDKDPWKTTWVKLVGDGVIKATAILGCFYFTTVRMPTSSACGGCRLTCNDASAIIVV